MTVNTIAIVNVKFGYRFWVLSTCDRVHTPLLQPSDSQLSRPISPEIFLAILTFFHVVVGLWRRDNVKCTCPLSQVGLSYHCYDSNTDDNDSRTISTIAQRLISSILILTFLLIVLYRISEFLSLLYTLSCIVFADSIL